MSSGGFKFPQPKAFDGKTDDLSGASKAREFISKCEIYFAHYDAEFKDHEVRARFVLFLCEESAYAWAAAYIDAMASKQGGLYDTAKKWEDFKKAFLAQFSSIDQKQSATRQLAQLRQSGKVSVYAAKFRELAAQTDWNDDSKIAVYYNGLRDTIKTTIATATSIPDKYEEYVNWTIRIGDRLDMAFTERSRPSNGPGRNRNRRLPGSSSFSPGSGGRPGPSANSARSGLSREDAERHMRENRCFKCHQVGHRANDPAFHPQPNASGRGAPSASTSGAPPKAGNATYSRDHQVDDDSRSEDQALELDAASFRPSGSRLPWREFEEVTLPSDRARSWRTKNT